MNMMEKVAIGLGPVSVDYEAAEIKKIRTNPSTCPV